MMTGKYAVLCAAVILAAMPSVALAQTADPTAPELVTDRPDFTESSEVVGQGVVQFESGTLFEHEGEGDLATRTMTAPQMLARIGLSRRVELRLGSDGFINQTVGLGANRASTSGYADVEVGAKFKLVNGVAGFTMAVLPMVSLPTGRTGFSSDGYDPTVKFAWAHDLAAGFAVSGNVNVSSLTADAQRITEKVVSVSVDRGFGRSWGAYWESYGVFDGGSCACTVNTGLTRALGGDMQADVEVGRGLSGAAPAWFVGVGFAVRRR